MLLMMKKNKIFIYHEPKLMFGYGQKVPDPRDGLTLFGPFDKGKVNNFNVGVIGTNNGIKRMTNWLHRIQKPIFYAKPDIAKPFYPGFQEIFGVNVNFKSIQSITVNETELATYYRYLDNYVRVSYIVDLFINKLKEFINSEGNIADLWFIIIPDKVYELCRPKSKIPKADSINLSIKDQYSRLHVGLFDDEEQRRLRNAYKYENHFHNQLKLKLLKEKILTQIIKESTIAFPEIYPDNDRGIENFKKFETAVAWNISTTVYYKLGGMPWKLGEIRDDVCYIGLAFKNDERNLDKRIACCAAQMFLDSGDGMVFKGAVGPWYNEENEEYHIDKKSAKELLTLALKSFEQKNGKKPKEIFMHGKTYFNDDEWFGFQEASGDDIKLVGIRIRQENLFKLFRNGDFPILRCSSFIQDKKTAYLWTKGFISRLQSVLGLETPNPLTIQIVRGEADIHVVCNDILSLTKLNYNSCIFCDGQPVTLKFADTIGEILTAGPNENIEVLPFKFYI